MFGDDSERSHKHSPLIKHPRGRARFQQLRVFILPLFTDSARHLLLGREAAKITKQEVLRRKGGRKKFLKRSPLSSRELLFPPPHAPLPRSRSNELQRSVVPKQNKAVPLGLRNNGGDPVHSAPSLGFILPLNAQMPQPFLREK